MFEEGARDEDPTRDSTIAPFNNFRSRIWKYGGINFTGGSRDTRLTVTHEPPQRHALGMPGVPQLARSPRVFSIAFAAPGTHQGV